MVRLVRREPVVEVGGEGEWLCGEQMSNATR